MDRPIAPRGPDTPDAPVDRAAAAGAETGAPHDTGAPHATGAPRDTGDRRTARGAPHDAGAPHGTDDRRTAYGAAPGRAVAAMPACRAAAGAAPVEWAIADGLTGYAAAVAAMEARAAAVAEGAPELAWLLEHPPLYTAGTSARSEDLVAPNLFPVHATGRGGQYTYHGPGQRIAYLMLDLKGRGRDVRCYVHHLEGWLIDTLDAFGVRGERREGRVGVWVRRPHGGEDKIAAIGVRVRRWVTLHGVALNVEPALEHYAGIVPCGVRGHGVTSLAALGRIVTMEEVDTVLHDTFEARFGPTLRTDAPRA